MYSQFRVQNFRGFKDLELKDLARINLIAGKNNVGKTALLEAIAVYSGTYEPDLLLRMDINQLRFPSGNLRPPRSDVGLPNWNTMFVNFDEDISIILSALYKRQLQLSLFDELIKLEIRKVDISSTPSDSRIVRRLLRTEAIDGNLNDLDVLEFITDIHEPYYLAKYEGRIQSEGFLVQRFPTIYMPSREQFSFEANAKRFSNLQRDRQQGILLDVLKVIDNRFRSLEILYVGYPPLIYAEIGLIEPIPLITMGDGINRVLSLVLAMSSIQNGILLIDEIENGLHYSIQKDVWKAIAKAAELFNVQIFATTHSFEMIRAAQEAFGDMDEDTFRFYRLDREDNGDIQAVKYSPKTMSASIEMDFEVRG